MAKLDKPKYLKLFDLQRIIKYIFCAEKRPHYVQLLPKPTKIVLVLLNTEHLETNLDIDSSLKSSKSNRKNILENSSYSSTNTDKSTSYNYKNVILNHKLSELGYTKIHLNENFNISDLHKNILKHKDFNKVSLSVLTEENLKLINRNDINHLFSYSKFIQSQEQIDLSIFDEYTRPKKESKYFLVALDCEMMKVSLNKNSSELNKCISNSNECNKSKSNIEEINSRSQIGRISILDHTGTVIYDKYVKPSSTVIDYLEQYSGLNYKNTNFGISEDQMKREVLEIIGKNTTIVGHGIENDLEALQLYLNNLIDTSYLYLNSDGHKIKLSQLSKIYFSNEIQKKEHDSIEDAFCCLKLLSYKISEILNFMDPNGETLDINVDTKEIKELNEIEKDRRIYLLKRNEFRKEEFKEIKGVYYIFLVNEGDCNYIYLKQKI